MDFVTIQDLDNCARKYKDEIIILNEKIRVLKWEKDHLRTDCNELRAELDCLVNGTP